jgi:tetratricopeptide (TPR) repeat protein
MKGGGSLYEINSNLSILCIFALIGYILTTVTLVLQSANNDALAQNTLSSHSVADSSGQNNTRIVLTNTSKYAEILKYYDKALAIRPNDTTVLDNKGIVLIKLGNYAQAMQYFDKVLSMDPNNVGGLYNKAVILYHLGKHTEAKVFQDKAQQINPNYSGQFINKVSIVTELAKSKEGVLTKGNP